ncbi:MAG: dihydroorotate dehydrogenase electron transfer subunit [Terriglobia bacterium]
MLDEIARVVENQPLTGGHFVLSLHAPRPASLTRPGQFAMVRLLAGQEALLRRPMSIYDVKPVGASTRSSANGHDPELIQLLYKVVGRGTRLMAALKPNDKVGLLAPLGHGFFEEEYLERAEMADEVLHVAGGIGVAALLLPAKSLARTDIRQVLFFGGRTQWDLVGLEDFAPFIDEAVLATEDGSRGYQGYVTRPLGDYLERHHGKKFLLMGCGPWAMLQATVELAERYGHPCMVSMENRMGCGLGVCLGCSIRVDGSGHSAYQRVCTEGPVFWAERVIWEKETIPKT